MSIHNHPVQPDADQPELDPAAERLRQKLVRLLLGSLGVMGLGLLAVFGAILYKVGYEPGNRAEENARAAEPFPEEMISGRIPLPAGSELLSASLDGDRALLQLRQNGGPHALWLVELRSGRVLARYDLAAD